MAKLTEEQRQQRALVRARKQALEAEEEDRRREARSQLWAREGTRLSWEEYIAGVHCRGCSQPILDGRGSWPPLMQLSDDEKLEHEAAERAFRDRHPDCRASRWSVSGSRQTHCGYCCPPPPMSHQQRQKIGDLLASFAAKKDRRDLDRWRLLLTCEHEVETTQHRSHDRWTGLSVTACPDCGSNRGIVQAIRIGPESGVDASPSAELVSEIAAATAKLARQEAAAAKTRKRLGDLTARNIPGSVGS